MPDPLFANLIVAQFIPQVESFARLMQRLLGSFGDITQEVREESNRVWREHQSQAGEGDPEKAAEAASDAALDLYASLVATRQAAMNLLAAGLYHLFEQQTKRAEDRCGTIPWDKFRNWTKVDELRLVANTVKHGEWPGSPRPSAPELRRIRPDLLVPPAAVKLGVPLPPVPFVSQPLAGMDVYVTEKDLENYANSLKELWREVAESFR